MQLDEDGNYYHRHVYAMTREELHSKSNIAAELAWRDRQLDIIAAERDRLRKAAELGLWYAREDLARRKASPAEMRGRWMETQRAVDCLESALRGEGEQ
jgi:hypothetical protein